MTVFTLFLILMMLIVGGMCVDVMRHETARARLQSVNDRAVLAAADLQQVYTSDWDAEDVVRDYFAKAGLLDRLTGVEVVEATNSRSVTARASASLDTLFMRLAGVGTLTVPASGGAQESANDIEIVLVLDVSGSMRDSRKIQNLRAAASEFVQDMLDEDEEHRISIGVVPFNAQVNLGPTLFSAMVAQGYNIANQHGVVDSYCIDTPAAAFAISGYNFAPQPASRLALPQAAHADGVATTTTTTSYIAPQGLDESPDGNVPCRRDPRNFVRLPSQSIAQLQGWIGGLDARGNTSITRGMDVGLIARSELPPLVRPADRVRPHPRNPERPALRLRPGQHDEGDRRHDRRRPCVVPLRRGRLQDRPIIDLEGQRRPLLGPSHEPSGQLKPDHRLQQPSLLGAARQQRRGRMALPPLERHHTW
jgi:Flp pilus assembly protein TadG